MKGNGKNSERFLYFRTEAVRKPLGAGRRSEIFQTIRGKFPDIVSGKSFAGTALERLGSPAGFAAMAMVPGVADPEGGAPAERWLDVARAVNAACENGHGAWGVSNHVVGCFFPVETGDACLSIAGRIRETLSPETGVFIGMAVYPAIHYTKHAIFGNAIKALDHAGFPGQKGMAVFDAVTLNISGDRLYQAGDIVGAMEEFEAGLSMDPANVNLHISLGVCHGTLGYRKKAMKEFDTAISLDPKDPMALYNKGVICLIAGEKKKALAHFIRADNYGKDLFEPGFQAGKICFGMKDYSKAERHFKKAAECNPRSGPVFRYLGKCAIARKDPKAAILAYKKAVKINPFDAESLSALGFLYGIRNENPEIAVLYCRHSVRISPENGLYRYRLGRLYLKQDRREEALDAFVEAARLGHDAAEFIDRIQNRRTAKAS